MPVQFKNITCPFCGLLCDDLKGQTEDLAITLQDISCERARKQFEQPVRKAQTVTLIDGQPVEPEQAYERAATILDTANVPLLAGLGADARGIRALLELARRCGGIVDHMHGEAMQRGYLALQEEGWVATTLGEIRNRADLVVFLGTDGSAWPRFHQRVLNPAKTLFRRSTSKRTLIYIGEKLCPNSDTPHPTELFHCAQQQLPDLIAELRCVLNGHTPGQHTNTSLPLKALNRIAEAMRQASYGVLIWDPGEFAWPHAELLIQSLCELIKSLNRERRFAGLALGGDDGSVTAGNICTWQSGWPLRVHFLSPEPRYRPRRNASHQLLREGTVDALLWVSSFSTQPPPKTDSKLPRILLTRPGPHAVHKATVHIPVATPGIDHPGLLFRVDGSVALPLQRLRESSLPTVSEVIHQIVQRL